MVDVAGLKNAQFREKQRMVTDGGCIVGLLCGLKIQADFPSGMFCEFERVGTSRSREVARAVKNKPGF
jgi:hypothetical protein